MVGTFGDDKWCGPDPGSRLSFYQDLFSCMKWVFSIVALSLRKPQVWRCEPILTLRLLEGLKPKISGRAPNLIYYSN